VESLRTEVKQMTEQRFTRSGQERLAELSGLQAGWMDGQGEEISPKAIEGANRLLKHVSGLDKITGIFPTLEGGVQFESDDIEIVVRSNGSLLVSDLKAEPQVDAIYSAEAAWTKQYDICRVIHGVLHDSYFAKDRKEALDLQIAEREKRLEGIIRRLLPSVNIGALSDDLRRDLVRDCPALRPVPAGSTVSLEMTAELFSYDGIPVLSLANADDRQALVMALPQEAVNAHFLVVVPTAPVMTALMKSEICLRTACLDEATALYVCDGLNPGTTAKSLDEPIHEALLPELGAFMSDYAEEITEEELAH
jgi:hypothetical protein